MLICVLELCKVFPEITLIILMVLKHKLQSANTGDAASGWGSVT